MFKSVPLIRVNYTRGSEKLFMGRLALKDRQIFFEYAPTFLNTGLELSPFKLPLKSGVIPCEDRLFDGLFGVFNDSLPDGWGRLLLDRKLMKYGVNPSQLNPLDRLRYVGHQGMGALSYEPEISGASFPHSIDLDEIADECLQLEKNDDERFIDDLLAMNGSSAGARPKILVRMQGNSFDTSDKNLTNPHASDWLIKFRSSTDLKDAGPTEYAYHLMAAAAGLDIPEARLFKSKKELGYFGVKRFDRNHDHFKHMHTISGLLHIDHRIPSLDYETIIKTTMWLTKDVRQYEKQFRYVVFNVLAHNRDDHAKNFSYLMNENGLWQVSPAYDLTFSSGPSGEHCTTVMQEGKNPRLTHLLKLAETASIETNKAIAIIEETKSAIARWQDFAKEANVTKKSSTLIQSALNHVAKNFFK